MTSLSHYPRGANGRWLLGVAVAVLVLATALILWGSRRTVEARFQGHVADLLPPAPAGWTAEDLPIADTPEMQKKVGELLNYDDGVFRMYRGVGARFSVYVAYWRPGRMAPRLVAGHTPDVCWVGAGWKVAAARHAVDGGRGTGDGGRGTVDSGQSTVGGGRGTVDRGQTLPVEERTMVRDGVTEYVQFWHLSGGESLAYGVIGRPPWQAAIEDLWRRGLDQRKEQWFIRISSDQPIERWEQYGLYRQLLERLPVRSRG